MTMTADPGSDVFIQCPDAGVEQSFRLASGVDTETVDTIRGTSVWPVESTRTDPDASPDYVAALAPPPADRYMVWMLYPPRNGKHPWGLIARDIAPGQVEAWTKNITATLSVQPMS